MGRERPRLLWTDDDGMERFEYERYRIEQSGWVISWALSVIDGARKLAETPFDAVLIDQMIPYRGIEQGVLVPWGGCLLLRWLRGSYPPPHAPLVNVALEDSLCELVPLPSNRTVPAMVVSAFHDDQVWREIRAASEMDRRIAFSPKTPTEAELLGFLKEARSGEGA